MKQTQGDKHTIAWFKIAECVSRGEKERALGVYRLLSHSFNDNAIARQLEADIYWSFGEIEQAIVLYQQAKELYFKSNRFLEAAAVGEHLVQLCSVDIGLHREMVQLYISLGMLTKIRPHLEVVIKLLAQKEQWYEIKQIIQECAHFSDVDQRADVYSIIIIASYNAGCPWDIVAQCIEQALDNMCSSDSKRSVQNFISALQNIEKLQDYALKYLKK